MRVKVRDSISLKPIVYGRQGTLIKKEEVNAPSGDHWEMWTVELDEPVDLDSITKKVLFLPSTCFEVISP
jgi:transcription initiation factor IIF auxiliary subunit